MMMTSAMVAEIKTYVESMELGWDYEYVGVRVQDVPFALGEVDHLSHVWDDGDDTGVELDGLCATKIDRLGHEMYYGDYVAIICGNEASYGEDDGEIIIQDPIVVKIIR